MQCCPSKSLWHQFVTPIRIFGVLTEVCTYNYLFKDHMMCSIFYNVYHRNVPQNNDPRSNLWHYYQMAINYINRSCKIKPEWKWKHCRTYTCCRTHALTETIEKIGLFLFPLFCNIFPLPFSIFSIFLITLVFHLMKSHLSFQIAMSYLFYLTDIFNKQYLSNDL